MYVDGDYEFYKFIWDGLDEGWCLLDREPLFGIEVSFKGSSPNAAEIKYIRNSWGRLKGKPVSELKSMLTSSSFVFGKWTYSKVNELFDSSPHEKVDLKIVEVNDYCIYNKLTHEMAQIRSEEVFDQVVQKLLEKECDVIDARGSLPVGGIIIEDV